MAGPAEAFENEALSYSLGNSLGNEYVMDGGIQIDGVESLSNQMSPRIHLVVNDGCQIVLMDLVWLYNYWPAYRPT